MLNWRFKNSVLGTYEIENSSLYEYAGALSTDIKYVDTSICYNNDYYLKSYLAHRRKVKVISKIPPQMINEYEFMVSNHLECLGRNTIDIMLIHNARSESWKELARLMNSDSRFTEIGVSNFTIDQIKEYKEIIGSYPRYNEMEINPLYCDNELIKFCQDNDIKIIAYAILGGKYNARRNISRYTLPYLLTFAGSRADLVILRSDNPIRVNGMNRFLSNIDEKDLNSMLAMGSDILNSELIMEKSIVPTEYKYPEIYVRCGFPTNTDQLVTYSDINFCKGFEVNPKEIKDDLGLGKLELPRYEFVSDYRAYLRYKVNELLMDRTGRYPDGAYIFPSTYIAVINERRKSSIFSSTIEPMLSVAASFNIITKDGKLSKVDDGESKFLIESVLHEGDYE